MVFAVLLRVNRLRARAIGQVAGLLLAACPACAVVLGFEDALDIKPLPVLGGDEAGAADVGNASAAGDATPKESAAPPGDDAATVAPTPTQGPDAAPPPPPTCVPAPTTDWSGPLAIFEAIGAPLAVSPPCAGAYPTDLYDGLAAEVAAPATCTCVCDAPQGVTCPAPELIYYADSACNDVCGSPQSLALAPSCSSVRRSVNGNGGSSCVPTRLRITTPAGVGGGCAPSATAGVTPLTWTAAVRLCAPAVAPPACGAGQVAVPAVSPGFQSGNYCVVRLGDWACPAGYPNARRYHQSATDTRGCSPCGCDPPAGASCPGAATLFGDTGCGGTRRAASFDTCEVVGQSRSGAAVETPTGGACAPHGGTPIGGVTPIGPTTICCLD
jgi:hypothetical protein